jgi:hypothetical protein
MTSPRPASNSRRVPECALNLPGLDAAYRIAELDMPLDERSELLTVALREHFSEREAKNKAKKVLSRVWLNPPPDAGPMISWALRNPHEFPDRRLLHTGALVATYPFVGSILAVIGRQAALNERLTVPDLRRRIEGTWGATATVSASVGWTLTTLRRLDVVAGGGQSPVAPATALSASALASTWLVHATLLTRQAQSIGADDALHAPELFWVESIAPTGDYPLLESHAEGPKRRVWATG